MKRAFLFIVAILVISFVSAQDTVGNSIEVEINNIDSDDGKMMIGLYGSNENWLKKAVMSLVGDIENGKCKVTFENVPDGIYAISSYHDENGNGNLDTNFLGIPKEDTGSSNNAPARMGPPKWEDAKFKVNGKSIRQTIEVQ